MCEGGFGLEADQQLNRGRQPLKRGDACYRLAMGMVTLSECVPVPGAGVDAILLPGRPAAPGLALPRGWRLGTSAGGG
jgi:hypothetical protein